MYRIILIFVSLIFLYGCQSRCQNGQCTRFYDDGRSKPVVSIVPMLDSTCFDASWSLSEEFTTTIKNKLQEQKSIFLTKGQDIHLSSQHDPFGKNVDWAKSMFKPTEFVVFLELVEHDNISILKTAKDPAKIPESRRSATNLNMAIRLRIVDIRSDEPRIVLQELVKDSYYMPNNVDNPDYNVVIWGTEEYKASPMSIAHGQIAKQIIDSINDYIKLAKSL